MVKLPTSSDNLMWGGSREGRRDGDGASAHRVTGPACSSGAADAARNNADAQARAADGARGTLHPAAVCMLRLQRPGLSVAKRCPHRATAEF